MPLLTLGLISKLTGYQEMIQTKKLLKKFSKITSHIIEPNKDQIEQYRETIGRQTSEFNGVEYEWHGRTFQDYILTHGLSSTYHFISLVHSIYYIMGLKPLKKQFFSFLFFKLYFVDP